MDKKQTGIWHPGETVYSHGTPPEYAYLIISGEVQFFSQKKVLLGSAGESEVFGEISCYLNRNHSVSAVARTNLVTKKIHKTELSKIFKNSHPVIMGMLRSTYHRLAEANIKNESAEEEIEKWTLMYQNDIKNSEDIKNKIEIIKEKIDNNKV
jgi:CRP-like cAMP-binding protein